MLEGVPVIGRTLAVMVLFLLAVAACGVCQEARWGYTPNGCFDHYVVGPTRTTPGGVSYDPSGQPINPLLIDRLVSEVAACAPSLNRSSFTVKVASDWYLEPAACELPQWGPQQLLPVTAAEEGCTAKGYSASVDCPCRWRAGVECPNIIVTTPSFYLFKDALLRFVTGSTDPWANSLLESCAQPTTLPLSDGTGP